jgi:hypothetical protein
MNLAPRLSACGYAIPGLLAIPVAMPWPAIFSLFLAGIIAGSVLRVLRENHRHRETLTALAKADALTPLDVEGHSLTLGLCAMELSKRIRTVTACRSEHTSPCDGDTQDACG